MSELRETLGEGTVKVTGGGVAKRQTTSPPEQNRMYKEARVPSQQTGGCHPGGVWLAGEVSVWGGGC